MSGGSPKSPALPDGVEPLNEVAERLGCSYRQAFHWVEQGYVRARYFSSKGEFLGDTPQGSGYRAYLVPEEQRVVDYMTRLVKAGFHVPAAAKIGRKCAETGSWRVNLGQGVEVVCKPRKEAWDPLPDEPVAEVEPVPAAPCPGKFGSQELECSLLALHPGWHRRDRLVWNDGGDWQYVR